MTKEPVPQYRREQPIRRPPLPPTVEEGTGEEVMGTVEEVMDMEELVIVEDMGMGEEEVTDKEGK